MSGYDPWVEVQRGMAELRKERDAAKAEAELWKGRHQDLLDAYTDLKRHVESTPRRGW